MQDMILISLNLCSFAHFTRFVWSNLITQIIHHLFSNSTHILDVNFEWKQPSQQNQHNKSFMAITGWSKINYAMRVYLFSNQVLKTILVKLC